jgi:hypothetical protein
MEYRGDKRTIMGEAHMHPGNARGSGVMQLRNASTGIARIFPPLHKANVALSADSGCFLDPS